jgi:hypothetical protein
MMRPSTIKYTVKPNQSAFKDRLLATLLFASLNLLLCACADPGSGGSGIPGSSSSPPPQVVSGPGNLSALRVEMLDANIVTIAGVSYLDSQIDITLSDGSAANFAALKVGQGVVITQTQTSPLTPRWKVVIQVP